MCKPRARLGHPALGSAACPTHRMLQRKLISPSTSTLHTPTRQHGCGLRAGAYPLARPATRSHFKSQHYRIRSISMRSLLALFAFSVLAAAPAQAQAQVGALYRCSAVEYTNMLSAPEAQARQCAKIGNAEWVTAGTDSAGNRYEYHDRRTVYRADRSVETWLQVVRSPVPGNDTAAAPLVETRTVSPQTIECGRKRIVSGPTYLFNPRDNTVIRDARVRNEFFPPPQTVAETLVRQLCAGVERPGGHPTASRAKRAQDRA